MLRGTIRERPLLSPQKLGQVCKFGVEFDKRLKGPFTDGSTKHLWLPFLPRLGKFLCIVGQRDASLIY